MQEKVEAEAARAEAEEPDDADETGETPPPTPEPEDEPEPEPQSPEPEGPQTQAEIDKLLGKLENEAARHVKRVAEIMGDEFEAQRAWALSFPPPLFFPEDAGPVPDDHRQWVIGLLGGPAEPDYAEAEDARPCPACRALGKTLTGSKVPEQRTKLCKDCAGSGWVPKLATPAAGVQPPPHPEENGGETGAGTSVQINDVYGRPPGHPHYGVPPAQIGA
jgi:hypothetical protein